VRIEDRQSFLRHREYLAENPIKAGLVDSAEKFPFCFSLLGKEEAAGAKAR
jgi:hypothetical protein